MGEFYSHVEEIKVPILYKKEDFERESEEKFEDSIRCMYVVLAANVKKLIPKSLES